MLKLLLRQIEGRELLRRVIGNTTWLVADRLLRMLAGLLLSVWVARYLGPEGFGLLSFAIAFVALFTPIADGGLQAIVVRDLVTRTESRKEILASALALRLSGAVVAVALTAVCIWFMRPDSPSSRLIVMIVALSWLPQAFDVIDFDFQARMQARPIIVLRMVSLLLFSAAKVAMILAHLPLLWFAVVVTAEAALSAILMWMLARRGGPELRLGSASATEMRRLLAACWPMAVSSLSVMLYMRIDQVMLGQMQGDKAVGVFSAAVRVSESWYFVPMAILTAVAPALTAAYARSTADYLAKLMLFVRYMFWIAAAVAVLLSLTSGWLIPVLFGDGYLEAATVLAVHAWAGVFASLGVATGPWFVNAGMLKFRMAHTVAGAVTNIAMNLYLIPHYGAVGAAVSTLVSYSMAAVLLNLLSRQTRPVFHIQLGSIFGGQRGLQYR